jgi:hypothetical protein
MSGQPGAEPVASPPEDQADRVAFEDLTFWELLGLLWREPDWTARRILEIVRPQRTPTAVALPAIRAPRRGARPKPRAAAERPPTFRLVALLHALQSIFVFWLLIVLRRTAEAPPTLQVQQLVLIAWAVGNTVIVYGVWRARGWANPALRISEGFLTLLSMLALIQLAVTGGSASSPVPDYVAWAGLFATVNLILGAAFSYRVAREEPGPPHPVLWIGDRGAYVVLLAMWLALALAIVADSILMGAAPGIRRASDILYRGSPILYSSMILWLIVALGVWQRRRLPRLVGRFRRRPAAPPAEKAEVAVGVQAVEGLAPARGRGRLRIPLRRVEGQVIAVVGGMALILATLILMSVQPIQALGMVGWLALACLWVVGSLLLLIVVGVSWQRVMLGQAALTLSFAAFEGAAHNLFTVGGVLAWVGSVVLWTLALRDPQAKTPDIPAWPRRALVWLRNPTLRFRVNRTLVAVLAITLIGAFFRFYDLEGVPPEMTSDHVEKLLDAARVFGDLGPAFQPVPQIFFPNNGGREPLQMYLVALAARITGLGFTFATLKIVSALEALVTLPLVYWMGRELVNRRAGLIAAALVAVSYWHTVLGRLGLRIVLTPLLMTLLLVYLARAMRHNRRADFLRVGLMLGVGTYAYQAMRMAPLIVLIGVGLAIISIARNWAARGRYLFNLGALVVIALAVFVPMGRFMLESPGLFWMRTAGRLAGDAGTPVDQPVSQFVNNFNTVIWMFNWKGDVQWISNVPNQPAFDPISGALLALGVAAWLFRLIRRRDPVDLTLLFAVAIMLLPSALSLAFPNENPSATRASGTLPVVYLWAALALDLVWAQVGKAFRRGVAALVAGGVTLALLFGAANFNCALLFDVYRESYYTSAKPYTTVGRVVRGFADSIGSMDTAFIVAYRHWLDHRAVGIEAGDINWVNRDRLLDVRDLNRFLPEERTTALMVLYNVADIDAAEYLRSMFPQGRTMRYRTLGGQRSKDFYIFIVPAPEEQPR